MRFKKTGEHKELRDIDICDTKISNAYVKEATYEPWIFGMLSTLAEVASRVRTELKSRENGYIIKDYSFPDNLIGTVYQTEKEQRTNIHICRLGEKNKRKIFLLLC